MQESEKWKWSCSVVSDSVRPHRGQTTRLLHPWDFPGKSTGVGCHCLLRLNVYSLTIWRDENGILLLWSFAPKSITSVYLYRYGRLSRLNSHKSLFTQTNQTVGHSATYLTRKNIKSEGSLRKCHGQEEFKKTWWLNIMWYPGWDPGKEKQQSVKAREIWIKCGF